MWGVAFAWAFLDTAVSLVPRPSPAPVSDRLQHAKTELAPFCILQVIKSRLPPPSPTISINNSTLASICYTVIYMFRVGLGLG